MTKEEYIHEEQLLGDDYKQAMWKLKVKYARSNNPYQIDDIIEGKDNGVIIKIDEMRVVHTMGNTFPSMLYFGVVLDKNHKPNPNGDRAGLYLSNL